MAERGEAARALARIEETERLAGDRRPALLVSRDGGRCLWANPAAGGLRGAARVPALAAQGFPPALARALAALAATLPPAGALARLPLAGGAAAPVSLCRASHVRLPQGGRALLVVAGEAVPGALADPDDFLADESDAGETGEAAPAAGEAEAELAREPEPAPEPETDSVPDAGADSGDHDEDHDEDAALFAALDARLKRSFALAAGSDEDEAPGEEDAPDAQDEAPGEAAEDAGPPEDEAPSPPPEEERRAPAGAAAPGAAVGPAAVEGASISAGRIEETLDRKPVRFLWQTDAASRVLFVSPGLAQVVGRNADIVGETMEDAAERLWLDPLGRIAAALQRRDTWSGLVAWWPVEGSRVRVPAELTALPVFGPDRSFQGYRGFGVLRPAEALMPAAFEARFGQVPRPFAEQLPPYEEAASTAPANVVPIRAELEKITEYARLTPQERNTFEEIAAALRDRIMAGRDEAGGGAAAETETRPEPRRGEAETPRGAPPQEPGAPAREASETGSVRPLFPDRRRPPQRAPLAGGAARDPRLKPVPQPSPPQRADTRLPPPRAERPAPPPRSPSRGEPPADEPPALAPAAPAAPASGGARDGTAEQRVAELSAILDTATDGVLVIDGEGRIESVNASAEALFGLDTAELAGTSLLDLMSEESRSIALDYLNGLRDNGVASLLNEGREVEATSGAGSLPLFMTIGRLGSDDADRFCAVLRDITHWKRAEAELVAARKAAEHASNQKSEFLARVSHEIRTPLNAIIGFAEVMLEEQFGPIENERYREYLRDIRTSGEHVVSLVNDLLDISKIEAGKLELNFAAVPLNDLVRECISIMQPQAGRARVVIRSSLAREVPGIVADERTLRQIVLNLLSNSVKYTGPGGQVIASTTLAETGEAVMRIRDTGAGMSEDELVRAMEPFRQLSTSAIGDRNSTGLGLPLTKALVEANRATFSIRSSRGEGTMVQITFPPTRVLSE